MAAKSSTRNYSAIAASEPFQTLMSRKKRFILPMSLFFLAFYFTLPVLSSYTDLLKQQAFGAITWAWVVAFSQFIMTWVLCSLYTRKAAQFDQMAEAIVKQASEPN